MSRILGSRCADSGSFYFWTAGQSVQPDRYAAFIWRAKSSNANIETLTSMQYTNWAAGKPNNRRSELSCTAIRSDLSYKWADNGCKVAYCAVCETDI